ncbi:MAG: hypothetical protein OJF48_001733 [Afipia sp.]|nr:MAG: hypothetical protein OJF48_001733 [Afipia sp.]
MAVATVRARAMMFPTGIASQKRYFAKGTYLCCDNFKLA